MMSARRMSELLVSAAIALAAIGCSQKRDELPREPVAGTVTMDGQPLAEAAIQFTPATDSGSTGAVAEVKDGKFSIPREDGLVPGTYKVSISHAEMVEKKSKSKSKNKPGPLSKMTQLGKEEIPARYNTQTTLKEEIKPGGAAELKYELQSK